MRFYCDMFFCAIAVAFVGWYAYAGVHWYGERWEFGPHGLPQALIDWETHAHPDGSAVEPMTLWLAERGWEDETMLVAAIIILILVIANVVVFRGMYRSQAMLQELRQRRGAIMGKRSR